MYYIAKDHLPEEGLYMLRYHSCYPIHREKQYGHLMNKHDEEMFGWVASSALTTCTPRGRASGRREVGPYYEDLAAEFFPDKIRW